MDTAITFSAPINGHVAYGWACPGKGRHVASDLFPKGYTRTEPPTFGRKWRILPIDSKSPTEKG